jgi:hypothetical protein
MGVRSTYGIKREVAKQVLIEGINRANDKTLAQMLEALTPCMNFCIDGEGYCEGAVINSVDEFFI